MKPPRPRERFSPSEEQEDSKHPNERAREMQTSQGIEGNGFLTALDFILSTPGNHRRAVSQTTVI